MVWKRRGRIIGILFLAQAGVIAFYYFALSGSAAPADPPVEPVGAQKQVGTGVATRGPAPIGPAQPNAPERPKSPGDLPPIIAAPGAASKPALVSAEPPTGKAAAPSPPEPATDPATSPPTSRRASGSWRVSPPEPATDPAAAATKPSADSKPASTAGPAVPSPMPEPMPPAPPPVAPVAAETPRPASPPPGVSANGRSVPAPAVGGSAASAARCPWILRVETVEGRTLLTAETNKNGQFRLSCECLNLQAPNGTIEAQGTVKVSGGGIEAMCDRLTICWQNDQVVLEGHAQMMYRRAGQDLEVAADRLSLRLSGARIDPDQGEASEPPVRGGRMKRPVGN